MPGSTIAAKCDQALASSDSGAILVSAGSSASDQPVFDQDFKWDRTGKRHVLKGQAAGAGGDRHNLQTSAGDDLVKHDANGTAHHYMGADRNPSFLVSCWHPAETDPAFPVSFNFSVASNPNPNGDPTSWDHVAELGWNTNGGGSQNLDIYTFRDAWEGRYWANTVFQTERHVGIVRDPVTNQEVRPITISTIVSEPWPFRTTLVMQTSNFQIMDEEGAQLVKHQWFPDTGEFSAEYPGWGYVDNSTVSSFVFGETGKSGQWTLNGNQVTLFLNANGSQQWALSTAVSDDTLFVTSSKFGTTPFFLKAAATPTTSLVTLNSRVQLTNANLAVGPTLIANSLVAYTGTATGVATSAIGTYNAPTLVPGNGNDCYNFFCGGTLNASNPVGDYYGIRIDLPSKTGSNAPGTAYNLWVAEPTIGTTNVAARIGGKTQITGPVWVNATVAGAAAGRLEVKSPDGSTNAFASYSSDGTQITVIEPDGDLSFRATSSTTANRPQARIAHAWATSTDASRKGRLQLFAADFSGTDREGVRVESDGTQSLVGFFGATAVAKPTVTGSRGGNAALASLLTALASLGLITDSSSA
jgi:hypothetical protein